MIFGACIRVFDGCVFSPIIRFDAFGARGMFSSTFQSLTVQIDGAFFMSMVIYFGEFGRLAERVFSAI